jgi:hypothetical protein
MKVPGLLEIKMVLNAKKRLQSVARRGSDIKPKESKKTRPFVEYPKSTEAANA